MIDEDDILISPIGDKLLMQDQGYCDDVLKNPTLYGLTNDEIDKIFDKYDISDRGFPGFPEREIILKLVKDGWIRIRCWKRKNKETIERILYHIELDKLSLEKKNYLSIWANEVIKKYPEISCIEVKITDLYFEPDEQDYTGEESPDENLYSKEEWRELQNTHSTWCTSSVLMTDLASLMRQMAYMQRVVGREMKLGRKLNKLEIWELKPTLIFSPIYRCSVKDVANGDFLISPEPEPIAAHDSSPFAHSREWK